MLRFLSVSPMQEAWQSEHLNCSLSQFENENQQQIYHVYSSSFPCNHCYDTFLSLRVCLQAILNGSFQPLQLLSITPPYGEKPLYNSIILHISPPRNSMFIVSFKDSLSVVNAIFFVKYFEQKKVLKTLTKQHFFAQEGVSTYNWPRTYLGQRTVNAEFRKSTLTYFVIKFRTTSRGTFRVYTCNVHGGKVFSRVF